MGTPMGCPLHFCKPLLHLEINWDNHRKYLAGLFGHLKRLLIQRRVTDPILDRDLIRPSICARYSASPPSKSPTPSTSPPELMRESFSNELSIGGFSCV